MNGEETDVNGADEAPNVNEADELNLNYQLIDFNDHGKLEHFVSKSANSEFRDLFSSTLPLGQNSLNAVYSDRNRYNVLAMKQLDRDTIFVAFENQVSSFRLFKVNIYYFGLDCHYEFSRIN